MEEKELPCCIRGYHVYEAIWNTVCGEQLTCEREPSNSFNRYAVTVVRNRIIIGHLPRKIAKVCSLFMRRGGTLRCIASGKRRYSRDLQQGGLEIPCHLVFTAEPKEIAKLK
jgi:hypothetical protein